MIGVKVTDSDVVEIIEAGTGFTKAQEDPTTRIYKKS